MKTKRALEQEELDREEREETEEERIRLAGEIAELEAEIKKEAPSLTEAVDRAREKLEAAKEAVRVAAAKLNEAERARSNALASRERQINRLGREIMELADPRIAELEDGLDRLFQSARHRYQDAEDLETVRAAQKMARALRTTTGVDVDEELERIRGTISRGLQLESRVGV